MEIKYFAETDTLYVMLNNKEVVETRDLDKDFLIDLDKYGSVVSFTIEHAQSKANISNFSFQQVLSEKAA